jgi:ankyrin repeat protein
MDDRLRDINVATAGTCEWLLQHETYRSWLESDKGLLWIRGKPGSGKSTLLRHAFNDATQNRDGTLVLSFFFHGRGNNLQKTPLGLLRSLAHQLFCKAPDTFTDLLTTFHDRCEKLGNPGGAWNWHERELQAAIQASISKVLQTWNVQLFVDALDEAGEDAAVELADTFKTWLQESPEAPCRWQICFSCRHYPIIDVDYGFQIHPEHENDGDIRTYVTVQGSKLPKNVQEAIISGASGVFMWARLTAGRALTLQRQGFGEETIKGKIKATPKELSKLYGEIIHDLAQRDDRSCLRLIRWICFAARPLTLEELRWAMIVGPDRQYKSLEECEQADDYDSNMEKRIRFLSGGLTELTASEPSVVQFIHQSVSDFFLAEGLWTLIHLPILAENDPSRVALDDIRSEAEYELSATCVSYVEMVSHWLFNTQGFERIPESLSYSDFPLVDYSLKSWASHMGAITGRRFIEALLKFIEWPWGTVANKWTRVRALVDKTDPPDSDGRPKWPSKNITLLHFFSRFGLSRLLEVGFKMNDHLAMDIDLLDDVKVTALHRACAGGHGDVAKLLLNHGAGPNVHTEQLGKQYTALHYAAVNMDVHVARILLDHGANVNAKTAKGDTALYLALDKGNVHRGTPLAMVSLLMERGAIPNLKNEDFGYGHGYTPLHHAVFRSYWHDEEASVRLLLEGGAHVNAQDNYGETPLHHRAWNGDGPNPVAVARLLLEHGANPNIQTKDGKTALHHGAASKPAGRRIEQTIPFRETIVRLLLEHGANVNVRDFDGLTPGTSAVGLGLTRIAEILNEEKSPMASRNAKYLSSQGAPPDPSIYDWGELPPPLPISLPRYNASHEVPPDPIGLSSMESLSAEYQQVPSDLSICDWESPSDDLEYLEDDPWPENISYDLSRWL